ncbi:MAG: MotA/TolQ/ExbB proton channel family protein [Nitrosomonas sp.]|nr:MotA/TolQ/ExbB proton channel family protein [Nitrosomonas sp.]MDP1950865.1 MotA/TolQ/ExbB proton channel family protein [Nitrosomonas sp.]
MKKLFFISMLLLTISQANAIEGNPKATAPTVAPEIEGQDASVPLPDAKPAATGATTPLPQKQGSSDQETINLETAYKREYAFLEAQKRELNERLIRYKSSTNNEEQALSKKINSLEQNSVMNSAKIDQQSMQLAEAERAEAAVSERSDVLEITYSQAEATLKNHDIDIPPSIKDTEGNDPAKVGFFFKKALFLIQALGAVQSKPGNFFLEDGKQTQGNIIHLGNIAAYGVSQEGSGSLVPAGGGDLKIWKQPSADTAIALDKNQQPDILKLFLFESRTTAIEESAEKTVMGIINSGGAIGWVIVALGAFAALLILIRTFLLYSNSANTKQLSERLIQQVADGRLDEARKNFEDNLSAITRVLSATLHHLKDDRDHMESIVHEAILQESGPLDRFGSAILVIASVSPLLGLLGTVTGMISTFDVITEFGTGDPKLLSGGISIALVTTELGLMVAIPALLLGSLLASWARNIKRDMEHSALRITNAFLGGASLNDSGERTVSSDPLVLNNQIS